METYCEKDRKTGEYLYFFNNRVAVSMCGAKSEDIVKVKISEDDTNNPAYWAYLDIMKNEYRFIFKSEIQVKMCSPDSFRNNIEKGKGKIVKVKVEEI